MNNIQGDQNVLCYKRIEIGDYARLWSYVYNIMSNVKFRSRHMIFWMRLQIELTIYYNLKLFFNYKNITS